MSYGLDLVLANKVLLLMALLSLAAWPVMAWGCARLGMGEWHPGRVRSFFWLWLAVFTFEFWFLGPYSFIAWDGEGNLAASMNALLARQPDGWFSHRATGGIDLTLYFPGKQMFQTEVLLARLLPTWIAVLLHKAQVAALGFWGAWLLARHWLPRHPGPASAVALLFPVSQDYMLNYSTEFGTGFAVIPLAVWMVLMAPAGRGYWLRALAVAALVALAQPMKVFPPLAIALVGVAIVARPAHWGRAFGVFGLYLLVTLVNWHEILYGLALESPMTSRLDLFPGHDPLASLGTALNFIFAGVWVSGWQILTVLAVMSALRPGMAVRLGLGLAWFVGGYVFLEAFPWERIGLDAVNNLAHGYNRLALPTLAVMGSAALLAELAARPGSRAFRAAVPVLAAAGLSVAVWIKLTNLGQLVWFGGQAGTFTHTNLLDKSWRPAEDFRTVTLFDTPHPNVVASFYGLDSFDGSANLDPKAYAHYWYEVMGNRMQYYRASRSRIEWEHWDGAAYHLDRHLRMDLLALANVRFIFAGLPLEAPGLRLVRKPKDGDERTKVRTDFFPSTAAFVANRIKRIFDSGELWIYEMEAATPRIFAADGVAVLEDYTTSGAANRAVGLPGRRVAVVAPDSARRLGPVHPMVVEGWKKTLDGYDVEVAAPDGGVLVINNTYFPFWKAEADGRDLALEPASGAHMAVSVPPGAQHIRIRYARPMLRDKIKARLGLGS